MTTYPNLSHEMNAALSRVQLPPSSIDKISAMQDASDEDQELSRGAGAKVNQARNRVADAQADVTRLEAADRDGMLFKERTVSAPIGVGSLVGDTHVVRERDTARLDAARELLGRCKEDFTRRQALHAERRERSNALGSNLAGTQNYLESLPPGTTLPARNGPGAKRHDGEGLDEAIARLRGEFVTSKSQREAILAAPLPRAEQIEALAAHVHALAERSAPTLHGLGLGRPEIRCPILYVEGSANIPGACLGTSNVKVPDALGLLAWRDPDALIERLGRMIETTADDETALSSEARAAKIAELEAQILDLERREESLIEQALDQGQVIRRRADADPRAILGICDPAEPTREAA